MSMRYQLKCCQCGATSWQKGVYEEDVNYLDLDDSGQWHGGETEDGSECDHSDFEVEDSEYIDTGPDRPDEDDDPHDEEPDEPTPLVEGDDPDDYIEDEYSGLFRDEGQGEGGP